MTIVLIGGSGSIGTKLSRKLLTLGDTVIVVDTKPPVFLHEQLFFIQCDLESQKLPFNVLEQTDVVINLIGVGFSLKQDDSLNKNHKSIINSTSYIVDSMKSATNRPTILINTSSIKYFGHRENEEITEKSAKGEGELADIVEKWENEAHIAESFGTRVVCIRSAMIISNSGFLKNFRRSSRFGVLFNFSDRDFWQPWIHEEDLVNTYIFALQTSTLQGVINAVAPETVKHSEFINKLAKVLNKKEGKVVPKVLKNLLFGKIDHSFTESQLVIPSMIKDKGFIFVYPDLESALKSTIKDEKNR